LANNRIASISCSGGEASLAADTAIGHAIKFPALNDTQITNLRAALGPMVALANPLDYHTYIWRDEAAMTKAWAAMMDPSLALTMLIVDFPRPDRCDPSDWDCAINAALTAKAQTGANVAMVATLPELMPEKVAMQLLAGGVVPLSGLPEAITAAGAAATCGHERGAHQALSLPGQISNPVLIPEAEAKQRLAQYGVNTPKFGRASSPQLAAQVATDLGFPVALKGEGIAHKTEMGAVCLNLTAPEEVRQAAQNMPSDSFLVEAMIADTIAELLIGIIRDPAHGFVLTIAGGGVLTEVLQDSISLLVPSDPSQVEAALNTLKVAKLLHGYRGKPAADISAIVAAIMAVQDYVKANAQVLDEIEINPLMCGPNQAIAADALLRQEEP